MRIVYSPGTAAEAHMLVHLLSQSGIEAQIQGADLQSAAGELPVSNTLQILVADDKHDEARAILLAAEQRRAPPEAETVQPKPARRFVFIVALAALIVGAVAGWFTRDALQSAPAPRGDTVALDQNDDGRPDFTYFFVPSRRTPARAEADNNFDGDIDQRIVYDAAGLTESDASDGNFDGFFEQRSTYKFGLLARVEVDTDKNGAHDLIWIYEDSARTMDQILDLATGVLVRVNHYENGLVVRADIDTDRDGSLDTTQTLDRFGAVTRNEKK